MRVKESSSDISLIELLVADGRPLLSLTAIGLLASGLFAIFLAARREFLPHDVAYLGIDARHLCEIADCRVVGFMFHDRVSFGGTLIAIAILYLWLAADPLQKGERWAWNAFAASGTAGFLSFLAYLGYGYLDTWHGTATLALLPCFVAGLIRSSRIATTSPQRSDALSKDVSSRLRTGRRLLLATSAGLMAAGLTILVVGMTSVFVPQDLRFMGLPREGIAAISPRLIPLIAHDRAGFGGGLVSTGILIAFCAWYGPMTRAFRQAIFAAGLIGFGCAIGVHYVDGYTNFTHPGPGPLGGIVFIVGAVLEQSGESSQ